MLELATNLAIAVAVLCFMAGMLITAITGAAGPVKRLFVILTGIFAIALLGGLIFSRGLLIYLLFQIIALIIVLYFLVIAGAVCGGGIYALLHKKAPGSKLRSGDLADYVPLAEFAALSAIDVERAMARIKSGFYQGGRHKGAWYIHKSELPSPNGLTSVDTRLDAASEEPAQVRTELAGIRKGKLQ
ncbi:MAG: hypothetical protein V4603_03080 [Pseudomonadota bacterium]